MLSQAQRSAILELHAKGVSNARDRAGAADISRLTVRKVLQSNSSQVPPLLRPEKAEPYRQQILELLTNCKGNLVRVQEELAAQGATFSYQALTAFCRRHGIGQPPTVAAGHYHFLPGEELQHDTSPHEVSAGRQAAQGANRLGRAVLLAHVVLPVVPNLPALRLQGVSHRSPTLLRRSSGATGHDRQHPCRGAARHRAARWFRWPRWPPLPNVSASASKAHERGDANRSGRVERPFHFIENNFLAGRTFASWEELNQQARQWCDRVNATYKKHIRAVPRELFALEQAICAHCRCGSRKCIACTNASVDVEGYVALHCNRYSVPVLLDRPPRRGPREQRQSGDPTRCPQPCNPPPDRRGRAPARHAAATPRTAGPGRQA